MEENKIRKEVKKQLWLAGPLFVVGLLNFSIQIISLMFVGHLGELPLSGASMATSFASLTGFNLLMGMASGLDTLCGQSFGAKQYHMMGIHTQKAMFILSLISLLLAIIWANTKPILIFLHQDPQISQEAGSYATFMIPSLFAYGILQCLVIFLQTQNNVFAMMLCSGITTIFHVLVCWALVLKLGLGSRGAALANSISYWINVLLLGLYVKFSPSCNTTWIGFSWKAFHNVPMFLKIAIPSAFMLCLKVWTFEVVVLLSGLLPNPKLETSVLSISLNTSGLVWMIPFGLGCAVSIRVSNELGAGNSKAASLAAKVVLGMTIIEGVLVGVLMILVRDVWGKVYSNEKQVIKYVSSMMPLLAASSFLDSIQSVLSGVARGCGWQKTGAYVNLGSFYLVGIPSSVVLAFVVYLKAQGLWLGIICAFFIQGLLLFTITITTNWVEKADEAANRVNNSETSADATTYAKSVAHV
ncbi:MATE efflux family protein [Euphorbia peplus]|nr:MATE efflux family protein [Euphorbia peplus]